MTALNWRDDPSIIWQDKDGDRLEHSGGTLTAWQNDTTCSTYPPTSPADCIEAVQRFAAALGCTVGDVAVLPEPLKVGDRVRKATGLDIYDVVGLHDNRDGKTYAVLARGGYLQGALHAVGMLTRIDTPPAPPEPVECDDPGVLAQAVRDGKRVEVWTVNGWVGSKVKEAARFLRYIDMDARYRIVEDAVVTALEPLTLPGLDITPTGMDATGLSTTQILTALRGARRIGATWRWYVGDLVLGLVDGDTSRLHEAWQQVAGLDIDDRPSLMASVMVAHLVPHARRVEELSWSHHKEVADLDADQQTDWLARARVNGWSVRELHEQINAELGDDEDQPELPGIKPWTLPAQVAAQIGEVFRTDPDARVIVAADGTWRLFGGVS